jgi:hypothetical protein
VIEEDRMTPDGRLPDGALTEVTELVGVYHANGTVLGELTYWIKARLGRGHCQLCDITHGSVREKSEWRTCRSSLPVPFTTVHLDERSPEVARATEGLTPCVVAVTAEGIRILLDPADLERCAGSPSGLVAAVEAALDRQGLLLPR